MVNIRKIWVSVAVTAATLPALAQYRITGQVADVPDGARLYLVLVEKDHLAIDSTTISNGRFSFTGPHQEQPQWALVKIDRNFVALADFYLEDGNISISGTRYQTEVHGTPTNEQYEEYRRNINALLTKQSSLNFTKTQTQDAAQRDSATRAISVTEAEVERREEAFVRKYPSSVISVNVIEYRARFAPSARISQLLGLLAPTLQQHPKVVQMREYAARLARTENGAAAPPFTLPDSDGRQVSLADLKGRHVLIDFWASWCAPCRASFPDVARLSEQYKSRGLTVIGISLDRTEAPWRKALSEEHAPWLQLWDKDGSAARDYAIQTIPHMVLVSPDGRIMGSYGKTELEDVLKKVFGE